MKRWIWSIALALVVAMSLQVEANEPAAAPQRAEVGKAAPDFELKNIVTDETVKLSDLKGKIVVLRWQGLRCPWDYMRPTAGYERVIAPMAQRFQEHDVVFLGINSNYNESNEDLKAYHIQHKIPYAYLDDPDRSVARAYGARTTPHMFVIDKEGVLRYMGGLEAPPPKPEDCGNMSEQYIVPVLEALINGSELPYTTTASKGCTLKYPRGEAR
jgi:peroxiredoxin